MRVNSLEIEVFELTSAVAVTRGRRNYEDEEEGPEEEEPEEGDEEDEPEEDEPEKMLWRSSTTFDYDGTMRTIVKEGPNAAVRQLRDASDSVSGEVPKAISLACHIVRNNPEQLGLQLYARSLNSPPPRAIAIVVQKTKENQTSPWLCPLHASLPRPGRGEIRTIVLNNLVTTAERNNDG